MKNTDATPTPRKRPTAAKLSGNSEITVEIKNHGDDPFKLFMNNSIAPGLVLMLTFTDGTQLLAQIGDIARSRGASGSTSATMVDDAGEQYVMNWRIGVFPISELKLGSATEEGWISLGESTNKRGQVVLVKRSGQNQTVSTYRTPTMQEIRQLG